MVSFDTLIHVANLTFLEKGDVQEMISNYVG